MFYMLLFRAMVLSFGYDQHVISNELCTSISIECEEIENSRNALTWCYSKKLPPNRKKSGKTLAKRPGRGIIAKPSDEGAPPKGGTESASGPQGGARGRGEETFSRKSLTRRGRESRLLSCANGGADSRPGPTGPGGNLQNRIL